MVGFLKYIESLNGDYDEYITCINEDEIKHIILCCEKFNNWEYKVSMND